MKPLNEKQRNNLFFQFLVMQVILIIVVILIVASYWGVGIKNEQVSQNSEQKLQNDLTAAEKFYSHMRNLENILTSVVDPVSQSKAKANFDIEQARAIDLIKEDSIRAKRFGWQELITGYEVRWKDKSDAINAAGAENQISLLRQERDKYKKDYEDCSDDFDDYVKKHP